MSDPPRRNEVVPLAERFEQWRRRAEEMRSIAENLRDPDVRDVLARLAADYDRMAERGEQGLN